MIARSALIATLATVMTLACGSKEPAAPDEAPRGGPSEIERGGAPGIKLEAKGREADLHVKQAEDRARAETEAEAKLDEAAARRDAGAAIEIASPEGFKEFKSATGGFRVEAPGEGKENTTKAPSALGEVVYNNIMFPLSDGALMVAWGDLPVAPEDAEMTKAMFDGGRDGMIKSIHGKLIEEKVIDLDGMEGRQWLIEVDAGPKVGKIINHVRTFLKGERNYILQGMHIADAPATKAIYFLDSFKLVP